MLTKCFGYLQNIYTEVREQGACALWALAGHTKTQQKYIAQRISIPHIIQMLLEPTEKLLHVGECGGGSFLACEDLGGRFNDSFPICALFFFN